jgi:hypothetical protein
LRSFGGAELVRYESELDRFVSGSAQVVLCLYDLDQLRGDVLFEIMKTHPMVVLGGTVLDNLYHVCPDELAAIRS